MEAVNGIYPTMITPYDKEGKVDYEAVRRLVDWYWKEGCDEIFASCLSSEIFHLSLEDNSKLKNTENLLTKGKSRVII